MRRKQRLFGRFEHQLKGAVQTVSAVTTTATYDGQDRLVSFGSKNFTYTDNGELLTVTDGSLTTTYSYDVFGNLKSVALPTKTISYLVDTHNRRISRLDSSTVTEQYIWNNNKLIGLVDGSGTLLARFIYGSKDHVPDYMITDTAEYMIVTNHLGSPVQVVDVNSGVVIQEIKYNVWGEIVSDTNPGFQPFGFAGCLYDQDTKLCRFGVRDYDASIGRWLSKDPILFNGGDTNLYGYVLQDPVNLIDLKGTWPEWLDDGVCGITGRCDPSEIDSPDWTDTLLDFIDDMFPDDKPDACIN